MTAQEFIHKARQALTHRDWGLAERSYEKAMNAAPERYDAAIELADLYSRTDRHNKAAKLARKYMPNLQTDPNYLMRTGELLGRLALHSEAWSCFKKANDLQPNSKGIQTQLALCATKVGELEIAEKYFESLLRQMPEHQRLHFERAKAIRAKDDSHRRQMQTALNRPGLTDDKSVFLLFAIGKSLEDQGHFTDAFEYYRRGNDAASSMGQKQGYDVFTEIDGLNAIREAFDDRAVTAETGVEIGSIPIFIVGLPRSGTTLLEKILTGHSDIESIDESFFLEQAVKKFAQVPMNSLLARSVIDALKNRNTSQIMTQYFEKTAYRRQGQKYFIEKYPFNFPYLGLIGRHVPSAKILYMRRHPMDVCFAMYKQPYFKYSFNLEDLGRYYLAYRRLEDHWKIVLGERIQFIDYELLVDGPEQTISRVMDYIGLDYSADLLNIHKRKDSSASASAAQVREKIHSGSVGKWKHLERQLAPLFQILRAANISPL